MVEAYPVIELDVSLDLAVDNLAQRNLSATYEVVKVAKVVNRLRKSKEVEYLIPNEVLEYLKRMIQTFAGQAINTSTTKYSSPRCLQISAVTAA